MSHTNTNESRFEFIGILEALDSHLKARLNILVACPEMPRPDISAGDRRLFALLKLMAGNHNVTLCAVYDPTEETRVYRKRLEEVGVRVLAEGWNSFHKAIQRYRYNLIIVEFWTIAESILPLLRRRQPWADIMVDTVDIHFMREEAGLQFGLSDAQTVAENKRREIDVYRRVDAVIVVTTEDDHALENVGGIARRFLIPLILPRRERVSLPRDREVMFVGGFRHLPNADAVLWFARDVWPAVLAAVPDAVLTVVGSTPPPEVMRLSGQSHIEVTGYVTVTEPYLDRAMVSVAPLRYGAGMKGKVSEAMMAGVPVVTTAIGAQGLNVVSGEHALIADDAPTFAQSLVSLLCDLERAERIGRAGQRHMETVCGPSAVEKDLETMLATVSRETVAPSLGWIARSGLSYVRGFVRAICYRTGARRLLRRMAKR